MGLPMWRAPSPEDAHDALKKDPTASARSPIRRRRPTRSPTSPRHFHNAAVDHHPQSRHDASSTRSRSRSRPPPPPPAPESPNFWRRGEHLSRTIAPPPPPPPPEEREARLFFRLSTDAPRGVSLDPRRPLPALTPNFAPATTSRNIRRSSRHDSPVDTHDRTAYPSRSPWDSLRADGHDRRLRIMLRSGRRNMPDGPLPSSSLRESWSPTTTVDGLGDRDRSLTPVEESSHWEPFLNGVVPDPLAPTADSSFTSAAASASFSNSQPSSRASSSNSNSTSSSRTHLTVPSRSQSFSLEQFLRNCDTSEDDSASDTEDEDIETPSSFHQAFSGFGVGTRILQNPYRQSRSIRDQLQESAANVRSFYGEITAHDSESPVDGLEGHHPDASTEEPAEERTSNDEELSLDQELRDARALLERLTRRGDVSDEFWASVGLQRPLADRLERIQQHERL